MFGSLRFRLLASFIAFVPSAPLVAQNSPLVPGDYVVSVSPHGNTLDQPLNTRDTVRFTVTNTGTLADAYTFSCSVTGGLSCVSVSPTSATIQPELFKKVTVIYDIGSSGGDVRYAHGGVPVLSGIPLVGGLLGRADRRKTETELYLFLTPRILRTDADADSVTGPRLRGGSR